MQEHAKKAQNAQDSYNLRQDMMRTKRQNQVNDFRNTTAMNDFEAAEAARLKKETDERIKRLEEEEMHMLNTM